MSRPESRGRVASLVADGMTLKQACQHIQKQRKNMWLLEKTGKLGTADQKISELFALLAESRACQQSETRWAHQYKAERDACMKDLHRLMAEYNDRRDQWGSEPLWLNHEDSQVISEIQSRTVTATITYSDGTQKQCYAPE